MHLRQLLIILCTSLPGTLLAVSLLNPQPAAVIAYADTLQAAKTAYQQALVGKHAWRDTGKLIKAAEQAAQQGDYPRAQQLAHQAKQQALNALEQGQSQSGVGNPHYLY